MEKRTVSERSLNSLNGVHFTVQVNRTIDGNRMASHEVVFRMDTPSDSVLETRCVDVQKHKQMVGDLIQTAIDAHLDWNVKHGIEQLPTTPATVQSPSTNDSPSSECAICCQTRTQRVLSCGHTFCDHCIYKLFENPLGARCPCCRSTRLL